MPRPKKAPAPRPAPASAPRAAREPAVPVFNRSWKFAVRPGVTLVFAAGVEYPDAPPRALEIARAEGWLGAPQDSGGLLD